jgi:hypothetical protein
MTAIIYFGEIFVASLLVIALLSISPHGVLSASELFIGGVVVWTLVEYLVHRFVLHDFFPMRQGCIMQTTMSRCSRFSGKYGVVSQLSILSLTGLSLRAR